VSFREPAVLLGLALLPLALLVYAAIGRRRTREAAAFANPALMPNLVPTLPGWRRHVPMLLILLAAAALVVALARAAFGADRPVALAAGSLGAFWLFAVLRSALEIDRALPRAALCGLAAWGTAALLVAARSLALASGAPAVRIEGVRLWPGALATAGACLVLAPLCLRLPGLAPLRVRRSRP
jgi:hypothetical protein